MKLNLGSGKYPLDGYTNVDTYPSAKADVHGDIRELKFFDVAEVQMSHLLEHISWRETKDVLTRIHGWMIPGGTITVEVPDMNRILERGTKHPLWFKYVYGDQSHAGEYHLAGFTEASLRGALMNSGWIVRESSWFDSDHPGREGMPCVSVVASA